MPTAVRLPSFYRTVTSHPFRLVLAFAASGVLVAVYGFRVGGDPLFPILRVTAGAVAVSLVFGFAAGLALAPSRRDYLALHPPEAALLAAFLLVFFGWWERLGEAFGPWQVLHLYLLASAFVTFARAIRPSGLPRLKPAPLVATTFAVLIGLGTALLMLPGAHPPGGRYSFVDMLFTATSAVCVTGLNVVDFGPHFTLLGQLVVLFLIQVGGLGITTLGAFFAIAVGGGFTFRESAVLADLQENGGGVRLSRLVRHIVLLTLSIEAAGALALFLSWEGDSDFPSKLMAAYYAVFHSISAFCNAGFALFADSWVRFRGSWASSLPIALLIVLGGLGFTVLTDLLGHLPFRSRRRRSRSLALQSKLVLLISAVLVGAGAVIFWAVEGSIAGGGSLEGYSAGERVGAAFFQSVVARTAGYSSVDIGRVAAPTLMVLVILMFIGASPGSTGGGIKTTTLGILTGALKVLLAGRSRIELFHRTIPAVLAYRALALVLISAMMVAAGTFALTLTESQPFLELLFEAVSAFGTVGLSTGITPSLSVGGKITIILLMYAGRVGPLTLALLMATQRPERAYEYPEGQIAIG